MNCWMSGNFSDSSGLHKRILSLRRPECGEQKAAGSTVGPGQCFTAWFLFESVFSPGKSFLWPALAVPSNTTRIPSPRANLKERGICP